MRCYVYRFVLADRLLPSRHAVRISAESTSGQATPWVAAWEPGMAWATPGLSWVEELEGGSDQAGLGSGSTEGLLFHGQREADRCLHRLDLLRAEPSVPI